ncbi:hypothetical protein C7B76_09255 [filamentous cyanobacterium CCP2]|nr:hypothetical protein C7B76_09255 [filamentous cyanobacterium CCP2]
MFSLLPVLMLAQAMPEPPPPQPQEIVRPQRVEPLPGQLDQVPVFNSNSPELVGSEGILLSTFPPEGMANPEAHLNFGFEGRFDVFAHHVFRAPNEDDLRSLYLGIVLYNPGDRPVTVNVLQAASYLSQPDAPFISLPDWVENADGSVYAGPGSRVTNDLLRGQRQETFPPQIEIPPGEFQLLMNLPIPVADLDPPLNGRSTLMRLSSNGTVYAASLALYAPVNASGQERAPTLAEWQTLLEQGALSTPRDRTPTPPEQTSGQIIYGRVAGVSQGSSWQTQLTDPDSLYLTIPLSEPISFGLSTLLAGRLGTEQTQSAPMLVRYPDTAYQAHGNYGVQYSIQMLLFNPSSDASGMGSDPIAVCLETPIKEDGLAQAGLRFFEPLPNQVFFRGTVRVRYTDDRNLPQTRYVHLVQRRGQPGEPLVTVQVPRLGTRLVEVDFLYPPDATPPQVLTLSPLGDCL